MRAAGNVFACRKRAGTLRWARGREGCSDSPLPTSGLHPPRNSNDDDRRQRRKQGGVVGAAASKTRVPPKARSGCWVPQPVSKGCTPLTILKKKSKHKKASAAPVGAIALTLFSLLHLKPLSRCATAPPRGSLWRARALCALAGNFPAMPKAPSPRGLSPQATGGVRSLLCALCPKRREIFLSPCVNGGCFASNRACRGWAASVKL